MLKETSQGISLQVKVIPKSSRNEIVGWENEYLKIRLRAVPEKGQANDKLIEFLSEALNYPKSKILLTHGETSRLKRVCFLGGSIKEMEEKLSKLL